MARWPVTEAKEEKAEEEEEVGLEFRRARERKSGWPN
jgi:hypothetical protein